MEEVTSIPIVAPPVRLRDSLYVMVDAARQRERVLQADDRQTVLEIIAHHTPGLVLLIPDGSVR